MNSVIAQRMGVTSRALRRVLREYSTADIKQDTRLDEGGIFSFLVGELMMVLLTVVMEATKT